MKSGLWVVIVVVTGIVGFLVGYSVSSYTGLRKLSEAQASDKGPAPAKPAEHAAPAAASGGYGATAHAAPAAASGGYGAAPAAAAQPAAAQQPAPAAGGYGAPAKPKPPVKPAAAGY